MTQKPDLGLLLLRIIFGIRLIYGTIDNVLSWERMLEFETFLAANQFPFPLACAVVSVYAQFLSGISWIIGYQVKISSLIMILNFVVALVGVHLIHGDTYLNMAPAIHLLTVSVVLFLAGPGKYSISSM
jgi:putative oxidoreductase